MLPKSLKMLFLLGGIVGASAAALGDNLRVRDWPGPNAPRLIVDRDIQIGSQILLEIDKNDVRDQRLDALRNDVMRTLRDARINWVNPAAVRGNSVEVRLREDGDFQTAYDTLRGLSQPLGGLQGIGQRTLEVTDIGGGRIRLTPTDADMAERERRSADQSIPIIEKRISEMGLAQPTIQRQGVDRILVQVPGLGDPQRLLQLLSSTAKLEFRLVNTSVSAEEALRTGPPADSEVLYENHNSQRLSILVYKQVLVGGSDLTDAQASFDIRTNEPIVDFKFNASGARKFGAATQENLGRPFAIVLDNEVISAPVIREPILGGAGRISGNFTAESANILAILLRGGALPGKFNIIDVSVITAPK
jgi:preprotein translocase subunit SecD